MGDRQIGSVDRTPGNRLGDRQLGAVDRTPGGRMGDRKLGAVDRTPSGRVGDGQLGKADRTGGDLGRAAIPGLAAAGGAAVGSRLSGDMQSQLAQRRSESQRSREPGNRREQAQNRFENRDDMVASRRDQLQGRMDNRPDRIEDRQQYRDEIRGDRQDYRDDARGDRQDYRDGARNDWQDWAGNNHWNDHWNHGHWHNHLGSHWHHMWNEHPVWAAYRVTAWGLNRASYLFGWGSYYNPYPVEPYVVSGTVIDYSEPLVSYAPMQQYVPADEYVAYADAVVSGTASSGDQQVASAGVESIEVSDVGGVPPEVIANFDKARAQFEEGQYEEALSSVDLAISKMPKDATLHEFRGLTLYALKRYRESAAAVHAVLAVGPGMDWTTMSAFYGDQSEYTEQLRALESYIRENRKQADARFLLAYHYITLGHNDPAIKQLQAVVNLEPNDAVASDLLAMLGGEVSADEGSSDITPLPSKGSEAELIGSWKSLRGADKFGLTLQKNGQFTWVYDNGNEKQSVNGVFIVDDGVLAMEPDSGGVMLADVSQPSGGTFAMRQNGVAGNPLQFTKQP